MVAALEIAELPRLPSSSPFEHLAAFRSDRLRMLDRVPREAGDLALVRLGWIDAVLASSPAHAQELLVERHADFRKSRGLAMFATPLIGNGILASHGEHHRTRRAIVAPAFHHKRIAAYADAIAEETERAIAGWSRGQVVETTAVSMPLALAVVARTLFGARVDDDVATIDRALTEAMRAMMRLIASPLPLPPSIPTPNALIMRRSARDLRAVVTRIVRQRQAERAAGGARQDVLGMLLDARDEATGEGLSERELVDEAITLFLAGHETTANALSWAWHLLARHPEVQAKLTAEARAVLGERRPTFEDLPRLPYALAVFKESMRLYPPAYFLGRRALRDTQLGGYTIDAGRTVFVNVWAIHRRADVYGDPTAFRPERFLDGADKAWPRSAYLPFGGGARVCVGNAFALMEGQLVLAQVAQRFAVEAPPDASMPVPEPLITLRPRPPATLTLA